MPDSEIEHATALNTKMPAGAKVGSEAASHLFPRFGQFAPEIWITRWFRQVLRGTCRVGRDDQVVETPDIMDTGIECSSRSRARISSCVYGTTFPP
jgi:hypothetical protein